MNRLTAIALSAVALAALPAGSASAAVYLDATGENHDGNAHMDFTSVTVTNDATNLVFTVDLRGSFAAPTDWGKYVAGIDVRDGGNSSTNPWNRDISMPGMDYWIGSWVNDGGGSELREWNGSEWVSVGSGNAGLALVDADTISYTIPLATLGIGDGSLVNFDFYTTGGNGGDGANDASANPLQASPGWGDPYNSAVVSTYQVVVPEPATIGVAALAALALSRRRR